MSNDTEKKIWERLTRKLFGWQPDETGKKILELSLNSGAVTSAMEIESRKVAKFERLL